jgi:hypothetical protein
MDEIEEQVRDLFATYGSDFRCAADIRTALTDGKIQKIEALDNVSILSLRDTYTVRARLAAKRGSPEARRTLADLSAALDAAADQPVSIYILTVTDGVMFIIYGLSLDKGVAGVLRGDPVDDRITDWELQES